MNTHPGFQRKVSLWTISLIAALTALWSTATHAQDQELEIAVIGAPRGAIVLISAPDIQSARSGDLPARVEHIIFRRSIGDKEFTRLNTTPVSRPASFQDFQRRAGEKAEVFATLTKSDDIQDLWQKIVRYDGQVLSLAMMDTDFLEILGLLYRDTTAEIGREYEYAVARSGAGPESEMCPPVSVVAGRPSNPLVGPDSVRADVVGNIVEIRWTANPSDSGVFSYFVYRALEKGGRLAALTMRPIIPFQYGGSDGKFHGVFRDSGVAPSRTYYYVVASRDYAGFESSRESAIAVKVEDASPPPIPQAVAARPSALGLLVTWDRVQEEQLLGYHLYRAVSPDSDFVRMTRVPVPPDTGMYEDTRAESGKQYYYRVTSLDKSNNESEASAYCFSTYHDFKPPLPPQSVSAVSQRTAIRIAWSGADDPGIRGYYVFRSQSLNGELVQISPLVSGDSTVYVDRDPHISPKGSYWYLVQAESYSGVVSPFSAPVLSSPEFEKGPAPPRHLRGYSDLAGNRLFWRETSDNTAIGYIVERTKEADVAQWEKITERLLGLNTVVFTDSTAPSAKSCRYRVRAVGDGGVIGAPSNSISLMRMLPLPPPPGGTMVTKLGKGFRVAWDASTFPGVSGYNVYRKTGMGSRVKLTITAIAAPISEYIESAPGKGILEYSVSSVSDDGRESDPCPPVLVRNE